MRFKACNDFYWECVFWLLLLLLGLAAAEGPFRISLPKAGFPSDLKILGGKMDAIFVWRGGSGEEEKGWRPHRKLTKIRGLKWYEGGSRGRQA